MMKYLTRITALLLLAAHGIVCSGQSAEPVRVVATLPILADVARQIGGDQVTVTSLARGSMDPHYVIPTPSLMAAVHRADLFVEVGLSLELWAENVLDGARNAKIRRGAKGHVYASLGVPLKEVPTEISRSKGDLHPEGNPHVWMDPVNLGIMASNIAAGLERVAPDRAGHWKDGLESFTRRLQASLYGDELVALLGGNVLDRLARSGRLWKFLSEKKFKGKLLADRLGGWLARGRALRGQRIVFYHQSWIYFADRFGLTIAGYIEDKPGIPPSAAHKEALLAMMRRESVPVVGILTYYDDTVARALAREVGATVAVLPGNVGATRDAGDTFALFDACLDRLLTAYGK